MVPGLCAFVADFYRRPLPAFKAPSTRTDLWTKDDTGKRLASKKTSGREKAGKGLRRRPAGWTTLCFIAPSPFRALTTLSYERNFPLDILDFPFLHSLHLKRTVSVFDFVS